MFPDRLRVAEVVVLREQAIEQCLVRRVPHLAQLERLDLGQGPLQRARIDTDHGGLGALGQRIGRNVAHRRQLDQARPVQLQHQPAAHHVAQHPVGLHPVPRRAQLLGQLAPTGPGMLGNECADEASRRCR